MGAALAGCCALAGISVVGQPVAADDAAGVPDVFVSGRDVLTEPGEVDVENTGFGRWRVGIGLAAAAYVPGDGRALGFESQAGDPLLTLVDVWTGETESGPSITQEANRLDVSTDGSVAFVRWGGVGGADVGVTRYSVPALDELGPVDFGRPGDGPVIYDLEPVPGAPARALVALSDGIVVTDGNSTLADEVAGTNLPTKLVAIDDGVAFGVRGAGVFRIEFGAAGVDSVTLVASVPTSSANREPVAVDPGLIRVGMSVIDTATFAVRPATRFELAHQDPTLPIRFLDGRETFDPDLGDRYPPSIIYDANDGAELERDEPACFEIRDSDVFLGDGLVIRLQSAAIVALHIPDACGSYGEFTPVEPARVLDTRSGLGAPRGVGQVTGGSTIRVKIHGLAGVPEEGVESVVLNVTALRQSGTGAQKNYITVWPSGYPQPTVSNLNVDEGQIVGNMVTVSTAAGGYVDIYSNRGSVDLTVDVMGYFASSLAPSGARFRKIATTRVVDTRTTGDRLGGSDRMTVDVRGRGPGGTDWGPTSIVAAVVNVTAVNPTQSSHFRIFPNGSPIPNASAMNFPGGTNTNRLVTVKTTNGRFDIWNRAGGVDVTVDLVGVYVVNEVVDESDSGRFVGIVPFRDLDTRTGSPFPGNGSIPEEYLISLGGFRANLDLVANLTAIKPTSRGYLSAGPWTGDFDPFYRTSSLNFRPGSVIANQAIIRSHSDGEIGIFNRSGNTHVALDIFGFYTAD